MSLCLFGSDTVLLQDSWGGLDGILVLLTYRQEHGIRQIDSLSTTHRINRCIHTMRIPRKPL
ncbi:hypothetical protein CA54_09770 [Symmachiella macrocystis]|uniref:Uncharacterized protein n=1 Tax=Symmachiella macrocystis TaxID=2527985 RepID=A0A5C6BM16_9PLAN|nr:hypothetical protein CA54_09770 [Symmachiella macrocystis]